MVAASTPETQLPRTAPERGQQHQPARAAPRAAPAAAPVPTRARSPAPPARGGGSARSADHQQRPRRGAAAVRWCPAPGGAGSRCRGDQHQQVGVERLCRWPTSRPRRRCPACPSHRPGAAARAAASRSRCPWLSSAPLAAWPAPSHCRSSSSALPETACISVSRAPVSCASRAARSAAWRRGREVGGGEDRCHGCHCLRRSSSKPIGSSRPRRHQRGVEQVGRQQPDADPAQHAQRGCGRITRPIITSPVITMAATAVPACTGAASASSGPRR